MRSIQTTLQSPHSYLRPEKSASWRVRMTHLTQHHDLTPNWCLSDSRFHLLYPQGSVLSKWVTALRKIGPARGSYTLQHPQSDKERWHLSESGRPINQDGYLQDRGPRLYEMAKFQFKSEPWRDWQKENITDFAQDRTGDVLRVKQMP